MNTEKTTQTAKDLLTLAYNEIARPEDLALIKAIVLEECATQGRTARKGAGLDLISIYWVIFQAGKIWGQNGIHKGNYKRQD